MMMGGGPPGMGAGPAAAGPGAGKKAGRANDIPKLFQSNKHIFFVANQGYKMFYIVRNFVKNGMFFVGWVGLFFLFPMALCYSEEQQKIMMKI